MRHGSEVTRAGCEQVASGGSRCIGSECNLLCSVLHDSRKGRMILLTWHSRGGGGRVPGEKRIHQDDEGVYKVGFLFIDNGIGGSNVFEVVIHLVGTVQG